MHAKTILQRRLSAGQGQIVKSAAPRLLSVVPPDIRYGDDSIPCESFSWPERQERWSAQVMTDVLVAGGCTNTIFRIFEIQFSIGA